MPQLLYYRRLSSLEKLLLPRSGSHRGERRSGRWAYRLHLPLEIFHIQLLNDATPAPVGTQVSLCSLRMQKLPDFVRTWASQQRAGARNAFQGSLPTQSHNRARRSFPNRRKPGSSGVSVRPVEGLLRRLLIGLFLYSPWEGPSVGNLEAYQLDSGK